MGPGVHISEHRLISPDNLGQKEDRPLSINQEGMFQHLEGNSGEAPSAGRAALGLREGLGLADVVFPDCSISKQASNSGPPPTAGSPD